MAFSDAELVAELPRIRRYAKSLTRNRDAAEDLVQDTMVRALAKRDLWEPGTDLRAWLFAVCHNTHVNAVRKSARVELVELTEFNSGWRPPTAETRVIANETAEVLQMMPLAMRAVVRMAADGMSYDDIADRMNVPVGTVRSRLSRGRAILRGESRT